MSGGLAWKKYELRRRAHERRGLLRAINNTKLVQKERTKMALDKVTLERLYGVERLSMFDMATRLGCSLHKVSYWMERYQIPKRRVSEAMYAKYNPHGDPFVFRKPKTLNDVLLYGIGLGLYWGEGTKADSNTVRLGNTNPALVRKFIDFLEKIFDVPRSKMRFGLQIFSDMAPLAALDFWAKNLRISKAQFYKVTVTKARSLGTYRKKSQYGVLTVYYHNKKLRDLLVKSLPM